MTREEYFNELTLIEKQNNTEYDLYYTIAALIKQSPYIKSEKLSVRAVFRRTKSARGQIFYGLSNFPDLVILDQNFRNADNDHAHIDNIDQIYGCIEVKNMSTPLLDIGPLLKEGKAALSRDEGQLLGDILWYGKVLYTNGRDWRYLKWDRQGKEFADIKRIVEKRIKVGKSQTDFDWYEEMKACQIDLSKIEVSEFSSEDWESLINGIYEIKWK